MRSSLFLLLLATPTASAQTWVGSNGSFQNPANWSGGVVPGPAGTATFGTNSTYLATFDTDWAVNNLTVNTGVVSLGLNGHTLTANTLNLGNLAAQPAGSLTLTNGTLLTNGGFTYANASNANFTLVLDGTTLSAANFSDMAGGVGSVFTLTIRNGSRYLALGNSFVGITGAATVTVDGTGSSFTLGLGSRLGSGNGSSGTVHVINGGAFHTSGSFPVGATNTAAGTVNLSQTGSSWTHTDGTIIAGNGSGASGTISVNTGSVLTVTGTGITAGISLGAGSAMNVSGRVTVGGVGPSGITLNGGTLTINAFGTVTTDSLTRLTAGSPAPTFNDGLLVVNKSFDLNVTSWTLTGGTTAANPTLQFQNGATATGITTLTVGNTAGRRGTMNVLSGSTATFSNAVTVGGAGTGTLLIDGPGSQMISSQSGGSALIVGNSGTGTATVQNGGAYLADPGNASVTLGAAAGASGTLTVTGAGSQVVAGGLSVGQSGTGTLNVLAGGSVALGALRIGETAGGSGGSVTVSGAGSTLTAPNGLFIGGTAGAAGAANSSLTVSNGGSVTAATVLGTQARIYPGGTLTINGGGSVTVGNLTRSGTLTMNDGTLTVNGGFFDADNSAIPLSIQGNSASALATLQIFNSTTSNLGTLAVGGTRPGAVVIGAGAVVSPNAVTISTSNSGAGSIVLSGANAALNVATTLTFGNSGTSSLTIGSGSSVGVGGALTLGSSGTINLNGGTLNIGSFTANGGTFNWSSGTVAFPGTVNFSATELTPLLGINGTLSNGRTLKGSNFSGNPMTFTGNLIVAGGSVTATEVANAASLIVSAGTVQGTNFITNFSGGLITVANNATLNAGTMNNYGELQFGGTAARLTGSLNNFGRFSGTGLITGTSFNGSSGRLIIDAGQRLVFGGSTNVNGSNGSIELTGGTIEFTSTLSNNANGLISGRGVLRGSTANVSGTGLANAGAVAFSGGFSDVFGKVNNLAGGQIVAAGGGVTTFHDDVVHNGTEIRTHAGARTVFFGAQSGAGPFTGTGTVEYAGDLRPGNSPALVTYDGSVVLNSSAKTVFEIGGTTPGTQYDRLQIAGALALGGNLQVDFLNGFTPAPGTKFKIIDLTGTIPSTGTFNGLSEGALFAANGTNFQITYLGDTGNDVVLTVQPVPEPAAVLGLSVVGLWVARRSRRAACSK